LLKGAIKRPGIRKDRAALAFKVHDRSAGSHGLLLQVGLFKRLNRFSGDLEVVVEKVLAKTVAIEETEALVRAALPELEITK
jgi:hypothetical protein